MYLKQKSWPTKEYHSIIPRYPVYTAQVLDKVQISFFFGAAFVKQNEIITFKLLKLCITIPKCTEILTLTNMQKRRKCLKRPSLASHHHSERCVHWHTNTHLNTEGGRRVYYTWKGNMGLFKLISGRYRSVF